MAHRILIAEDDEDIRMAVKILLESDGREVHEASDGVMALDMARKLKPDVLILDVMMPGKVGYRVCKDLKEDPETSGIFIIFLTARGAQAADAAFECGGDEVLAKPFDIVQLREKVEKALSR